MLLLSLALAAALARGPVVGKLRPRLSAEIASSKWSIGTETMDRNLTIFADYESYLPPLGAKRARLQCGWGRCDLTGTGAPYNWAWLDEAVHGLSAMGSSSSPLTGGPAPRAQSVRKTTGRRQATGAWWWWRSTSGIVVAVSARAWMRRT